MNSLIISEDEKFAGYKVYDYNFTIPLNPGNEELLSIPDYKDGDIIVFLPGEIDVQSHKGTITGMWFPEGAWLPIWTVVIQVSTPGELPGQTINTYTFGFNNELGYSFNFYDGVLSYYKTATIITPDAPSYALATNLISGQYMLIPYDKFIIQQESVNE